MIKHENQCVGCPTEMGCLGGACPYVDVEVCVCDECKKPAIYVIDGVDLCEICADEFLNKQFNKLKLSEMAEILGLGFSEIND